MNLDGSTWSDTNDPSSSSPAFDAAATAWTPKPVAVRKKARRRPARPERWMKVDTALYRIAALEIATHSAQSKTYSAGLRVMAAIAITFIVIGLIVGLVLPGKITGVLFPFGISLIVALGVIARRADRSRGWIY